jgi:hypothetical protein
MRPTIARKKSQHAITLPSEAASPQDFPRAIITPKALH